MNKKYATGLLALAVCFVAVSGAYAFGGFGQGNEAAKEALENNDYTAFVEAISKEITEERFEQMVERFENRQAVQQALEAGDYDAWVKAIESRPKITDVITEENFPKLVEMHEARQQGDFETAKATAEELGLTAFRGMRGPMGSPYPLRGKMRGIGQRPCFQGIGEGSE